MRLKIFKDWQKKLLILFISFGVWLYVFQTVKTKRVYTVYIDVVNQPISLIAKDDYRKVVDVEVEGDRALLNSFNAQTIRCTLDLKRAKKGKNSFNVTIDQQYISPGLNIMILNPEISITFEELFEKRVRIIPKTEGTSARGFLMISIELAPSMITIVGPERVVKQINQINTLPVDIEGKFLTYETEVQLENIFQQVKFKEHGSVKAKVVFAPMSAGRIFKNIRIDIVGLPPNYYITNGHIILEEIEIMGSQEILAAISEEDIKPYILITQIKPEINVEVKINIINVTGAIIANYKPKIITLKISER